MGTVIVAAAPAWAQAIDDTGTLASAVDRCVIRELARWHGGGPRDATLRLAFRRDGSILGAPRVTYSSPARTDAGQESYIQHIVTGLQDCAPLPFSSGFGAAIAGRTLTFRYTMEAPKEPKP